MILKLFCKKMCMYLTCFKTEFCELYTHDFEVVFINKNPCLKYTRLWRNIQGSKVSSFQTKKGVCLYVCFTKLECLKCQVDHLCVFRETTLIYVFPKWVFI